MASDAWVDEPPFIPLIRPRRPPPTEVTMRTSSFNALDETPGNSIDCRHRVALRRATLLVASAAVALTFGACKKKASPTQPVVVPTTSRASLAPSASNGYVEARTSQIPSNGATPGYVFDDFRFTGASTIRTVSWQGIYCVQQANSAAPAPTATGFTVAFYPDNAGQPNFAAPIQSTTYTLAQVNQTFEKNQSGLTCGTAAGTNWAFYKYTVTLTTPFVVTPNTRYWFSAQARTPSFDVYWGWRDGLVDNSTSLLLFNGAYTTNTFDRAFALTP